MPWFQEHVSTLLLNGYQTVEDLRELTEQHLCELNMTDPEQRRLLLATTHSLSDAEGEFTVGFRGTANERWRYPRLKSAISTKARRELPPVIVQLQESSVFDFIKPLNPVPASCSYSPFAIQLRKRSHGCVFLARPFPRGLGQA